MARKGNKDFKDTPEAVVLDGIEKPINDTKKEMKMANKRLDSIERVLKEHLYFIKDSKDDGKKTHYELQKISKVLSGKGSGSSTGGGTGGGVLPSGSNGGDSTTVLPIFGGKGMFGKVKNKMAGLKKGFDSKKMLKRGGILGVIYGALDSVDDYKEVMNIDENQKLNLKQRISGATAGVVNSFGEMAQTLSGGIIKWNSADTLLSIDNTINDAMKPIEHHYKLFKANFPTVGESLDSGFGLINDTMSMVQDGWSKIFDWTGKFASDFGDSVYEGMFGTQKQKNLKVANEKANILFNNRKSKELEKQIKSTEENRAKYDKDSDVYKAFTRQIEGYTKQLEELAKQNETSKVNIRNINSSGTGIGGAGTKGYEGFRSNVYKDTEGHDTIGYGHKLTADDKRTGRYNNGITKEEAEKLYQADKAKHNKLLYSKYPWVASQPASVRMALEDMAYNMGIGDGKGLSSFNTTLEDIKAGRYESASNKIKNSRYATQVGQRAFDNANRIRLATDNVNSKESRVAGAGKGGDTYITNNNVVAGGGGATDGGPKSVNQNLGMDSGNIKYHLESMGTMS